MPLTKTQKQKILEDLKEKIAKQKAMIFVDFTGLKVKGLSNLRKKLKAADSELKVVKKTLIGLAFKKSGLEIEAKKIKGEIALIFGYGDEISPAKMVYQFSQENPNLKILGGFIKIQNAKFKMQNLDTEQIIELATIPTKDELLSRLVGRISAPISNFVNVLQGNLRNLVFLLSQIKVTK